MHNRYKTFIAPVLKARVSSSGGTGLWRGIGMKYVLTGGSRHEIEEKTKEELRTTSGCQIREV